VELPPETQLYRISRKQTAVAFVQALLRGDGDHAARLLTPESIDRFVIHDVAKTYLRAKMRMVGPPHETASGIVFAFRGRVTSSTGLLFDQRTTWIAKLERLKGPWRVRHWELLRSFSVPTS